MKNIIFIAPPAAGKGTQAAMFHEKYNIPNISVGSLLREEAEKQTEIGKLIREKQAKGILVDDWITNQILKDRLMNTDCDAGYILDGYPRSLKQAESYEEILKSLGKDLGVVIYITVPYEETKKRIVGRRSCKDCGTIYNIYVDGMMPDVDSICDKCGGELIVRSDDNEESFKVRYETYLTQTEPLIKFYKDKNVLYEVESSDPLTTFSNIEAIVRDD